MAERETLAVHRIGTDGSHTIEVGPLRVLLSKDVNSSWFAQGLEIDYAATASSEEEVKDCFERGLISTIHVHIQEYGTIDRLVRKAPEEEWRKLDLLTSQEWNPVTVSVHRWEDISDPSQILPFSAIEYYVEPLAA